MYEFTYKWPLHTFLHTNCIMPKLCSFMLNYASYANIMPIMLYAPAMLLCQFLCWHNPLTPTLGALAAVAVGLARASRRRFSVVDAQ